MSAIATVATGALDWVLAHPWLSSILAYLAYVTYSTLDLLVLEPRKPTLNGLPTPSKLGRAFDMRHLAQIMDPTVSAKNQQEWRDLHGKNIKIQGFGYWDQRLLTFDTRAINHILVQATEMFPKPWQTRRLLANLLGNGVVVAEGDVHKRQRKIINPAFSLSALRKIDPVFHTKAEELRNRWRALVGSDQTEVDVNHWIGRATFDAFALAGFDYSLNAIQNEEDEVYLAYKRMFDITVNKGQSLLGFLEIHFPRLIKMLPNEINRELRKSKAIIKSAGEKMLKFKRDAILDRKVDVDSEKYPRDQRDILSLMIKANLAESSKQRMTDTEILSQIHTFFFAGSDNVGLVISYILHLLSLHPSVQSRLREELQDCQSTSDVGSLPFLDQIVRETLRMRPTVQSTIRVAAQNCIIPTEDGAGVNIRAGQFIHVPIEGMNMAKELWGPDAFEFNPDRWSDLPETVKRVPGLISNLMTFSVGGHSCPGAQFAIMEVKAFVAALVPAFEFAPSPKTIVMKNRISIRPFVKGEDDFGPQLPMLIKPYTP